MNRIEKGSLLVLAIIVAFNIFFGLGSIPLLDPCLLYTSDAADD